MVVTEGVENADATSVDSDTAMWQVKEESVLELGADAGLSFLVSVLAQVSQVTVTDRPSSLAFAGALRFNMTENIPQTISIDVSIQPHEGGVHDDTFAIQNKDAFTCIIAADCY